MALARISFWPTRARCHPDIPSRAAFEVMVPASITGPIRRATPRPQPMSGSIRPPRRRRPASFWRRLIPGAQMPADLNREALSIPGAWPRFAPVGLGPLGFLAQKRTRLISKPGARGGRVLPPPVAQPPLARPALPRLAPSVVVAAKATAAKVMVMVPIVKAPKCGRPEPLALPKRRPSKLRSNARGWSVRPARPPMSLAPKAVRAPMPDRVRER